MIYHLYLINLHIQLHAVKIHLFEARPHILLVCAWVNFPPNHLGPLRGLRLNYMYVPFWELGNGINNSRYPS